MRYDELTEYNKNPPGDYPETIVRKILDKATAVGMIATDRIFYYEYGSDAWYILSTLDKSEIKGHVWIEQVEGNIWKVKNSGVKTPGKGIGTDLYFFIIRIGNQNKQLPKRALIHDWQLSPAAEKLWKEKLPNRGLRFFVYDKKLNKRYSLSDVGKKTSDGVEILDPEQDVSDYVGSDPEENIRFFWLAECEYHENQPSVHPLKQKIIEGTMTDLDWNEILKVKNVSYFLMSSKYSTDGEY